MGVCLSHQPLGRYSSHLKMMFLELHVYNYNIPRKIQYLRFLFKTEMKWRDKLWQKYIYIQLFLFQFLFAIFDYKRILKVHNS